MCKWWRLVYCCTPHIVPTFTRSMKWRAKPDKMTLNTGTNTEAKYNVNHYSTQHAVATPWLVPQKFCVALTPRQFVFTARSNYTSAILEIVILSVRLSVCLWHACFVTNYRKYCRYFDTTWKGNQSSFLKPTEVDGRCSLPPEICA